MGELLKRSFQQHRPHLAMLDFTIIEEYCSPRAFHLAEVVNGGVVVLHSYGGMFLGDAIDLVFLGPEYLNLPFEISGIRIYQPCDAAAIRLEREVGVKRTLEEPQGKRVFKIECLAGTFQVIAAKMWVVLRAHEGGSSLRPLFSDVADEREKFINEKVRELYKMAALYS